MKTVRWGIIGCGDVTEVKSGPGLRKASGSELVAVMRRDGAKARDYAQRHGVPHWFDDAGKLIADAQVDAVYVATPPDTHEEYALKVAAAGKPCYVEKPMARNTAAAQRMVAAFEAARLPLYVAYYRRGLPRFRKVKELLASGRLGTLRSVSYRFTNDSMMRPHASMPWRLDARIAGAGLFLDLASHALDLLDFWFGPLQNVAGRAANVSRRYAVEDTVEMTFTTPGGVTGRGNWSFISDTHQDEYHLVGEAGELRFSCFGQEPFFLRAAGGGQERFDLPYPPHVQQPLIQLMVDEMNGVASVEKMPSTGASGLRTQTVMDAVLESYYGPREDGCWQRLAGADAR